MSEPFEKSAWFATFDPYTPAMLEDRQLFAHPQHLRALKERLSCCSHCIDCENRICADDSIAENCVGAGCSL